MVAWNAVARTKITKDTDVLDNDLAKKTGFIPKLLPVVGKQDPPEAPGATDSPADHLRSGYRLAKIGNCFNVKIQDFEIWDVPTRN